MLVKRFPTFKGSRHVRHHAGRPSAHGGGATSVPATRPDAGPLGGAGPFAAVLSRGATPRTNRHHPADLEMAERLRYSLRTVPGLSAEAGHFWEQLGDGAHRDESSARDAAARVATRDGSFLPRTRHVPWSSSSSCRALRRSQYSSTPRTDAVQNFRWQVDAYLPFPEFVPNTDPPWVPVQPPTSVSSTHWPNGFNHRCSQPGR